MGAYVYLLEYNNIEGMILFSDLSRRRIRSVSSLVKVGRTEPVMVLRVDKEKGYIDLSKRRVSKDIQACEERYNKSKLVHSIMRHVAETLDIDLEAMRKADAAGNDDCPVKIKLVAPTLYVLTTQTLHKDQGIATLTKAITACTEAIRASQGETCCQGTT
ncbi:Eukaryotic translation initiation factor 2 subunit 1 [Hibiscus syriacus]|uniref:Eukaryotic translation initiation factor 2 subunit 1 n=1 Tax=Hibiscus syriacus TaxID=106335 RepID=A0A6A2YEF0_HIBSY|nr:Eukaryotic translation initiation factor 2 subunit 1 [Hibiscus syriacus]